MKAKMNNDIDYQKISPEWVDTARAIVNFKEAENEINHKLIINSVIPPEDNVLRKIAQNFDNETDIPVEMAVFYGIAFIAGYLLQKKIRLDKAGQWIYPDLWLIVLAPSGAAKTFSASVIEKVSEITPNFSPGFASSKAFCVELQQKNFGFLFRDELGQLLKAIEQQPHMAELRDYLLRTKDGKEIVRETPDYSINVSNPHIVFLGSTVSDTFNRIISLESLLDGFSQRFLYILAKKDKTKKFIDYLDYNFNKLTDGLKEYFEKIKSLLNENDSNEGFIEYSLTDNALEVIKDEMAIYFGKKYEKIPDSFRRRIYFEVYKLAMVFHFALLKESRIIDEVDIRYASKAAILNIKWLIEVLELLNFNNVAAHIKNVDKAAVALSQKNMPVNVNTVTRRLLMNHKTTYADINETRKIVTALLDQDTTKYNNGNKQNNQKLTVVAGNKS